MVLSLHQLRPTYFTEERVSGSQIWGRELLFSNGDLVKVVAPSGTGKTSLVHFLYGLRQDYTGQIYLDEKDLKMCKREEIAALRQNRFSVVLQDMRLFAELTLLQNLEIKRQLSPLQSPEKIFEMASRLEIDHRLQAPAKHCSYGEQQRTAILRALLQPFDFLLLDEPFSHLDDTLSKKAMELILEEVTARKAGIIFAELERVDYFPATHLFHL